MDLYKKKVQADTLNSQILQQISYMKKTIDELRSSEDNTKKILKKHESKDLEVRKLRMQLQQANSQLQQKNHSSSHQDSDKIEMKAKISQLKIERNFFKEKVA
jgi:hypothetical protein